jgi:hypothetical protein
VITADLERDVVIRGAVRIERTARGLLPRRATEEAFRRIPDDFMRASVGQSAGIRLAFRTAATRLELRVSGMKMTELPDTPMPEGWYDVTRDGEIVASAASMVGPRFVFSFERPDAFRVDGPDDVLAFDLPGGDAEYELWLPYTDEVELLGLSADALVLPATASDRPRWLHHGSSISHGYIASRTTNTWPVIAARGLGFDLTSVAYSGNALLDQLTARTIRDTPADLISLKLGINVVNGDHMRRRVFRSAVHGFLDTIRDGHPATPILVISPIHCPPVERVPGPTYAVPDRTPLWVESHGRAEELAEGKLSLEVIRDELRAIVDLRREWDAALGYFDGSELYGAEDNARMPLPDNLHPADDVNALLAERFTNLAKWPSAGA